MQVYRGLPLLTNQSGFPARLVGILGLGEEGSVADYQRLAHAAIDEILASGRTPIVVGGTGLYLRAALAKLELPPPPAAGELVGVRIDDASSTTLRGAQLEAAAA